MCNLTHTQDHSRLIRSIYKSRRLHAKAWVQRTPELNALHLATITEEKCADAEVETAGVAERVAEVTPVATNNARLLQPAPTNNILGLHNKLQPNCNKAVSKIQQSWLIRKPPATFPSPSRRSLQQQPGKVKTIKQMFLDMGKKELLQPTTAVKQSRHLKVATPPTTIAQGVATDRKRKIHQTEAEVATTNGDARL